MQYHAIAFVGFKVTGFKFNGSNNGTITGSFQKVTGRGPAAGRARARTLPRRFS
jgi:hypothetical protein